MPLGTVDYIPLIPLVSLSVIYWIRDRYLYNRVPDQWWTGTRVQLQVLVFLYPCWVFLSWTTGLQARRKEGTSLLTTTGTHLCGHLSTVAILNDSFYQTRQQIVAMFIGLLISYLWTVYNITAFSDEC